ncbi:ParA family protein [Halorussus caseinilyticus]|uniref:ParA family protein n=1 Tax=Halorussus caseinilyticus TaxID=3034025 RepID=UPI0023E802C9|nr:ParA family protein [Halorussus sp. DT72]
MLTYAVYSEAGGVGKTTLSANLARAHADNDHDVLVVDLDPQDGSLSHLLGVDDDRADSDADTLVHHLIDRPKGDFTDLLTTTEGIDVLPSHNRLEDLGSLLDRAAQTAEDLGEPFNKFGRLQHVLAKNDIPDTYDILVVDPPATVGPHLYNAIYATRSLTIPVEPTGKGSESVDGLESVVAGIEDTLDIHVGVLAAVVNRYEGTNDQQTIHKTVDNLPYPNPVTIRKRSSLFEKCWSIQGSAFAVEDHDDGRDLRDYEHETLDQLRELADFLEERGDL